MSAVWWIGGGLALGGLLIFIIVKLAKEAARNAEKLAQEEHNNRLQQDMQNEILRPRDTSALSGKLHHGQF